MKKHIPNMITSCNLLCGAVAIYLTTQGQYNWAFLLMLLAAVFDFLDGMVARLLHVSSPIGKELDSLADDITFGLLPATMLFCYLYREPFLGAWAGLAFLMAAFSALRLAKFNTDERQTSSFIGLATPANAIFWASLICTLDFFARSYLTVSIVLLCLSFFSCYLLIAEVPMFSLKFHSLRWADNKVQYIFLIGCAVIMLCFIVAAILLGWQMLLPTGFCIIVWYVAVALEDNLVQRRRTRSNTK